MKKYILQLMMLCIVFYSTGMEVEKQDPSKPCNDICYLNEVPSDILSYIARFLMETEEEFIARTQATNVMVVEEGTFFCQSFDLSSIKYVFCPDENKCLMLGRKPCREYVDTLDRTFLNRFDQDSIKIIDSQKKNNGAGTVMYEEEIDDFNKYTCCAVSRSGDMIALMYAEKGCYDWVDCKYDFFEVQKVGTSKKRNLYVPDEFFHNKIAFNKQGTHLIAYGKTSSIEKPIYNIISLKIIDSKTEQVIIPTTNRLQEYFRDKCVCNKNIEGKK